MFAIASSTARVTPRQSASENFRSAVKLSTVARTTHSKDESLGSIRCRRTPSPSSGAQLVASESGGPWNVLGPGIRGKTLFRNFRCLLGKVIGSLKIPAKEPDLAVHIPLQE